MTSKQDKKPHDALAKKVLENPVAAREFLEEYLPREFKEYIDIATLIGCPRRYYPGSNLCIMRLIIDIFTQASLLNVVRS